MYAPLPWDDSEGGGTTGGTLLLRAPLCFGETRLTEELVAARVPSRACSGRGFLERT